MGTTMQDQNNVETRVLDRELLHAAIAGRATAIRCRSTLQPAAGPGTKVFPPTYAGGVYATEQRRVPVRDESGAVIGTREADCVLLDSVQSQANRIEEALQHAIDEGRIEMPLIEVDFRGIEGIEDVQRVTSLQAPHRAADAILRDSLVESNGSQKEFRNSDIGHAITESSYENAIGLFRYCPHALFLGLWDSTGPKGGMGAKFARALVSEIVGIDAVTGRKTSSRIDPLQIRKGAAVTKSKNGTWQLATEAQQKKAVSPSEINHGNIPPDVSDGGVTIEHADHTAVLSFPQLRRLRFPVGDRPDGATQADVDAAARTVLAALALVGLTLSLEQGCDLRSRCLLFPEGPLQFELLETPGQLTPVLLNSDAAIAMFNDAAREAQKMGLPWNTGTTTLKPSANLVALVRKSQELAKTDTNDEGE